ncbi:MAG: ChaN family lipoprotein [Planctomycetota bacterium]
MVQEVLNLQRALWKRVARQARKLSVSGRPSLRQALREFEGSFPERWRRVTPESFVERSRSADFVLVGDYHPLPRAQVEAAGLLHSLRPRTLALEIFPSCFQGALDFWAEGRWPAPALFERLDFAGLWGRTPRHGYETLLETARSLGLRLLAVDHPLRVVGREVGMEERDAHIARILLQETERLPCLLLIGDVHLSPERLPALLGERSRIVIHQNHAPYHFELQQLGIELPAMLQIAPGRYVYQHTHPLLVEESSLLALGEEDCSFRDPPEEWLPSLLAKLCRLQNQPCPNAPTTLCTFEAEHRDLLTMLMASKRESEKLVNKLFIKGQAFLTDTGPLVLHLPGMNHLSEAAGKWLLMSRSPPPPPRSKRSVRFLADLRLEAAGFLASLLVNPLRDPKPLYWYRDFLQVKLNWKQATRCQRLLGACLAGEGPLPVRELPAPDTPAGLVLARVLGQELGCFLHRAWEHGDRARITDALYLPLQRSADLAPSLAALVEAIGK